MATIVVEIPDVDPSIINSDPGIMGGQPVFPGTRVPVQLLLDELKEGASLVTFLRDYPTVDKDKLFQALDHVFARTIGPPDDDDGTDPF